MNGYETISAKHGLEALRLIREEKPDLVILDINMPQLDGFGVIEKLRNENNIECRPLICGSINEHPFWYERYGKQELPISKRVHEYGLYLPNNHQMTIEEVDTVINIVNQYV
jgi:CheY-like chemotaxis protein